MRRDTIGVSRELTTLLYQSADFLSNVKLLNPTKSWNASRDTAEKFATEYYSQMWSEENKDTYIHMRYVAFWIASLSFYFWIPAFGLLILQLLEVLPELESFTADLVWLYLFGLPVLSILSVSGYLLSKSSIAERIAKRAKKNKTEISSKRAYPTLLGYSLSLLLALTIIIVITL